MLANPASILRVGGDNRSTGLKRERKRDAVGPRTATLPEMPGLGLLLLEVDDLQRSSRDLELKPLI